jgi:transcriptional regulator with XRE-family HTH domain
MSALEAESLGQRIRRLRQERALSLAQVAGDEFSRAFLNQVEAGRSQPSTRVLRVIAARLGTQVEYLLTGSAPTLEREITLERARIALARAQPASALSTLEALLGATEWPLGADARLAAAEALIALGRHQEADRLLAREAASIALQGDELRMRRLRALRSRRPLAISSVDYAKLADRSLRRGDRAGALEHYRAARVLLEAGGVRGPVESRTWAAGRPPEESPRG